MAVLLPGLCDLQESRHSSLGADVRPRALNRSCQQDPAEHGGALRVAHGIATDPHHIHYGQTDIEPDSDPQSVVHHRSIPVLCRLPEVQTFRILLILRAIVLSHGLYRLSLR